MQMTKTKPDGSWNVVGSDGKIVPWKDIQRALYGALYKLHAYEKTNLNPETIEIMVRENKRLCEGILELNKRVDELQRIIEGGLSNVKSN